MTSEGPQSGTGSGSKSSARLRPPRGESGVCWRRVRKVARVISLAALRRSAAGVVGSSMILRSAARAWALARARKWLKSAGVTMAGGLREVGGAEGLGGELLARFGVLRRGVMRLFEVFMGRV